MAKHVRLKPYNPRRGCVMRKYTHGPTNKKFEEAHGWYLVDDGLAHELENVHQIARDPDSPLAFDVTDLRGAKAIDAAEKKAKEKKDSTDATDLTTRDLRSGTDRSPADERREARAKRLSADDKAANRREKRPRAVT
jgi:hypothetical protein